MSLWSSEMSSTLADALEVDGDILFINRLCCNIHQQCIYAIHLTTSDRYLIDDIHYTRYYVDGHCTELRRDCCHPPDWSHEGLAAAAWPPASSVCTGVVLPWRMSFQCWVSLSGDFRHRTRQHILSMYSVDRKYYLLL